MGILPHHCPLITLLQPGEIAIKQRDEETLIAVGGGFLEVRPDRVIILADIAERDNEVDAARAAEAKRQAQIALQGKQLSVTDKAKAEAALRHALACLRIAEKRKKKRPARRIIIISFDTNKLEEF